MNRIYIPELWIEDNDTSTNYQSWTTNYVTRELNTLSGTYLKTDGTNKPSSNINFNQNSLINLKSGSNNDDAITKAYVDNVYNTFEPVFEKINTTIFPVLNQIVTASSEHAVWTNKFNAFDNNSKTEWVIGKADVGQFGWIQIELLNAIQIWKVSLSPRNGNSMLTHVFNDYYLEGSNDGIIYNRIFESKLVINQTRIFEFDITPKYRFFKLTGTGLLQYGLSSMDLFEAKTFEVKVSAGGGIELNSSNALKLQNNVPRFLATFPPNLIENLLVLGYDITNKTYWVTDSSMTVPARNQAISKVTDVTDKQYVDLLSSYVSGGGITRGSGGLELEANVYRHSTVLNTTFRKFLPVAGEHQGSNNYRITDSSFTVPDKFKRPLVNTDVTDKQYVDLLSSYVSGGGITRGSGGLELESNVYRHSTVLNSTFRKFLPVAGEHQGSNNYRITDSSFTIPNKFQRPILNTDIVDKQYTDDTFLSKAIYDVKSALPGIPITNGLVMSFVPSLNSCTLDANSLVTDITDPLSKTILSTGSSSPTFGVDTDQLNYLDFNNNELIKENVSVSDIGGSTGKTTTFFFIGLTHTVSQQNQFNWMKGTPGNYTDNIRLGVHLPWSNNRIYIDHGAVIGGRLSVNYSTNVSSIIGNNIIWCYVRNGANASIYKNQSLEGSVSNLTSKFNPIDVGRFSIGNGNNVNAYSTMRFYGLFFYNRALNLTELNVMHIWLKQLYQI